MTSMAGESRRSSVRALNVSPQAATSHPSSEVPTMRSTLSAMRSYCSSLTAMTPRNRLKS